MIIHLGDLMDQKKYGNYVTVQRMKDDFIKPMTEAGMYMRLMVGNHDTYMKDTNVQNSPETLLKEYENIEVLTDPVQTDVHGLPVLLLPWICKANAAESARLIKESTATWVMGHLEMTGFGMYRGVPSHTGLNPSVFGRFEKVLSGHFHHRNEKGNVLYVGSTCQYNWHDHGDIRGFHILDTVTRELEFVPNPSEMFMKIHYEDSAEADMEATLKDLTQKSSEGRYVKLIVRNKENPFLFDRVVDTIEKSNVMGLQVVEDHKNANAVEIDDMEEVGDTLSILMKHVEASATGNDRELLKELISDLYAGAIGVE
jgi:UDP-2,3-diacylglucosamine pyrophosphatase LpxH